MCGLQRSTAQRNPIPADRSLPAPSASIYRVRSAHKPAGNTNARSAADRCCRRAAPRRARGSSRYSSVHCQIVPTRSSIPNGLAPAGCVPTSTGSGIGDLGWVRARHPRASRRPKDSAAREPLRGVLPLPFARQALARPSGISAGVLDPDPGDRACYPTRRRCAINPVREEVLWDSRRIAAGIKKRLELCVGDRISIDREGINIEAVAVARRGSSSHGYCTSTPAAA